MERLAESYGATPFHRVLVPGCGTGELERDLLAKNLCRHIDAFDVSETQVAAARDRARAAGVEDRIDYRCCTMDRFTPSGVYDACFFHAALHHFDRPRDVLRRIKQWLAPGAIVYLDEYVGPSRQQWNRRSFAAARAVYSILPEACRHRRRLAIPGLLAKLSDPSESIASDEILAAVEAELEILVRRDYHGFILQPIWTQIEHSPVLVRALIDIERALAPFHPTWFAVLIGRVP